MDREESSSDQVRLLVWCSDVLENKEMGKNDEDYSAQVELGWGCCMQG